MSIGLYNYHYYYYFVQLNIIRTKKIYIYANFSISLSTHKFIVKRKMMKWEIYLFSLSSFLFFAQLIQQQQQKLQLHNYIATNFAQIDDVATIKDLSLNLISLFFVNRDIKKNFGRSSFKVKSLASKISSHRNLCFLLPMTLTTINYSYYFRIEREINWNLLLISLISVK